MIEFGPVRHSPTPTTCSKCHNAVDDDQLKCEKCEKQFHINCAGLFLKEDNWVCPTCVSACIDPSLEQVHTQRSVTPNEDVKKARSNKIKKKLALKRLEEQRQKEIELEDLWLENKKRALAKHLDEKYKLVEEIDEEITDTESDDDAVPKQKDTMIKELQHSLSDGHSGDSKVDGSMAIQKIIANDDESTQSTSNYLKITSESKQQISNPVPVTNSAPNMHSTPGFQPVSAIKCDAVDPPYHSNKQSWGCDVPRLNNAAESNVNNVQILSNYNPTVPNFHQFVARQSVPRDLPKFSGRPEEWPLFFSAFERTTRICGLTDDENIVRLQNCLKGDALEAVRARLNRPSNVPRIMEFLKEMYGQPQQIIRDLLSNIRREPSPTLERTDTLMKFYNSVENLCAVLEDTHLTSHFNNPLILEELVDKLPLVIKYDWSKYMDGKSDINIAVFCSWLSRVAISMNKVTITSSHSVDANKTKRNKNEKGFINAHNSEPSVDVSKKPIDMMTRNVNIERKCWICQGSCLSVKDCSQFLNKTPSERLAVLKSKYLCFRCLRKHGKFKCRVSKQCSINGCTSKHHPLIHDSSQGEQQPGRNNEVEKGNNIQPICTHQTISQSILFRIIPIILFGKDKNIKTHAFLDDGSSITLIEGSLATELGLDGEAAPLCLKWTADTHRMEPNSQRINVQIAGCDNPDKRYTIVGARTVDALNLPTQSLPVKQLKEKYSYLRRLPIEEYHDVSPKILIGLDNWSLGIPTKAKEGDINQPVATKSRLGWCVYGRCGVDIKQLSVHHSFHSCECDRDDVVQQMVKNHYALESLGVVKPEKIIESADIEQAHHILENTSVLKGNRYEVGLLWRYDEFELPESYNMAQKRLLCLESRMSKEPQLSIDVKAQMENHIIKGYVRKLTDAESRETSSRTWYLPVFPVKNPNKPGKTRLVWDAAARSNGVSLNSMLVVGPDQLVSLPNILLRFREKRVAISADIKEMFHQVMIRK